MELRELKYFLAIAKEQNISKAAESLFVTQPSLSRQMQHLEKEIGKQLFVRGARKITLTDTGLLLQKRAEEILALYDKTIAELTQQSGSIAGDIHIGSGESYAIEEVARVAKQLQSRYPDIKFHFFSGDTHAVIEQLDKGLIDFGILVEPADVSQYNSLKLRQKDTWGVLMRKDSPLAKQTTVSPQDLYDKPLIRSKHAINTTELSDWFRCDPTRLNVVATYNLIYNASILVREGLGYAIGLDKLINTSGDSDLCFRPLEPKLQSSLIVAWKSKQIFSTASQLFLDMLKQEQNNTLVL